MLIALENYYHENKIYPVGFECRYESSCNEAAARKGRSRYGSKSTYVGAKYEEGVIPRLLFLSLDPGNIWYCPTLEERTPYAVRQGTERAGVEARWTHWYGTHLLTLVLLSAFDKELDQLRSGIFRGAECRPYEGTGRLAQVTPYFAHVNSAKCCVNIDESEGNAEAPRLFFKNCSTYLEKELAILKPDIVVSQGAKATAFMRRRAELSGTSPITDTGVCDLPEQRPEFAERAKVIQLAASKALWIRTSHPRNGRFWTEGGKCWVEYENAVKAFLIKHSRQ